MTTKIVIRHAENINKKNEIARFDSYGIEEENISALSWEIPNEPRAKSGGYLLKKMISKVSLLSNKKQTIGVMLELTPEQPNNAIVNHKKTWGLVEGCGVDVNKIINKISHLNPGKKGLVLTGTGRISLDKVDLIQNFINTQEKLYFSSFNSYEVDEYEKELDSPSKWMKKCLGT